jgi:all-trans-retinol 13,14-reductase
MHSCHHQYIIHRRSRFTPEAVAALRPETPIENLLLTGQDVFSGGFVGAMFGGLLSASAALGRNLYVDLLKARAANKA